MKVLLIADREELRLFLENELSPLGAEILHYWHPIKAMDNLEEASPEAVLFSAQDFPRHWTVFLVYLRASACANIPFILLKGKNFKIDESKKAETLGITEIFSESFEDPLELEKLKEYITPPSVSSAMDRGAAYRPQAGEKAHILFTHPQRMVLVQGRLEEISLNELRFEPLSGEGAASLSPGLVLRGCSVSILDFITSVDIEITGNTGPVTARLLGRARPPEIMRLFS
ncbi:MAG: PilZ domain-containing protein [Spirochaetales bacterium]|jgi:CheY-like chemotaxis protein|nr:PilZ domain-containing protein [Spirochaetales bacterium]